MLFLAMYSLKDPGSKITRGPFHRLVDAKSSAAARKGLIDYLNILTTDVLIDIDVQSVLRVADDGRAFLEASG